MSHIFHIYLLMISQRLISMWGSLKLWVSRRVIKINFPWELSAKRGNLVLLTLNNLVARIGLNYKGILCWESSVRRLQRRNLYFSDSWTFSCRSFRLNEMHLDIVVITMTLDSVWGWLVSILLFCWLRYPHNIHFFLLEILHRGILSAVSPVIHERFRFFAFSLWKINFMKGEYVCFQLR